MNHAAPDADRPGDKMLAAAAAVAEVASGMLVGLGTGSTAAHAIRLLAARRLAIDTVATSAASAALAAGLGLRGREFAAVSQVDLTIDGADEIDARLWAIKGAGGAMLREKAVAAASTRMVVIADGSKRVAAIGAAKLPVEVLPFARAFVLARLGTLFDRVVVRDGVTDNGNLIADGHGAVAGDWPMLARQLSEIPGVMGHGLFLSEVDAAYIADAGVVTRLERSGDTR